jgi:hypothetical protein
MRIIKNIFIAIGIIFILAWTIITGRLQDLEDEKDIKYYE